MKHRWLIVALLVSLTLMLIASCSLTSSRTTDQSLSGRMLLWHSLNTSETEALNQVINSFAELNPQITIKVQVFSNTVELNEQYFNSAASGLGPDLILAPSSWVETLHSSNLINPIDNYMPDNVRARFSPSILEMLQINEQTYGLPLALDTMSIFVNRQLVETPASNLAGVIEQANAGTTVLMPINFFDAFWGIQAFGGQLFDQEGRTILDQGGFANWLAWLRDARSAPGVIQDTNRDVLRQRFLAGNAGYYIGYAAELNEIIAAIGQENITVIPLPMGPVGPAGPFVSSQAFYFSSVSSENQRLLATQFAQFVTNSEQSSRLMRLVRFIPANTNVRINPRLFPIVAALATQTRTGVPIPTRPEFEAVLRYGNEAYIRTLEGGEPPAEVAFSVNNRINEANGFPTQSAPTLACTGLGTIFLAHSWQQPDDIAALEQIITNYRQICPLVIVETQPMGTTELPTRFNQPGETGFRASFGLVNQQQLTQLMSPEIIAKNMNNLLNADMLQRFAPISIEAMRRQGNLYGVPLTLETDALYYNRQLVTSPAQTLDELRAQALAGVPITLDTRFEKAFWGIRAFGGQLYAENGAAVLNRGGMGEWLLWLIESRDNAGIKLSTDGDEILRRFIAGESAYYVGSPNDLAQLQEVLQDNLGVALLPSGPAGPAQPLVRADGFILREGVSESSQALALEFMRYATDLDSQNLLMNEAHRIPANANVPTTGTPYFEIFVQQAQTGYLVPNSSSWQSVVDLGNLAYTEILENGDSPVEVIEELTDAINRANGVVVTPTPAYPPPDVLNGESTGEPDAQVTPAANGNATTGDEAEATEGQEEDAVDNEAEAAP